MTDLSCDQVRDLGTELALGVLPAEERARALAHLDRCPDCREHVEQLAVLGDGLLQLVPGREPPLGFETRVMARLGPARAARSHRRLRLAAAAAAVALVAGVAGWAIGVATAPSPAERPRVAADYVLVEAALRSGGDRVGTIYAYSGRRDWVYMWVRLDPGVATVSCQLVRRDGSVVTLGWFPLRDGTGYWAAPSPVDPAIASGARVVGPDGSVLATARFT